jgi:hypothetical protein
MSNYEYPVEDIQKAIVANLPIGVGAATENHRGFYSKIFTQNQYNGERIPLIMKITILGDRRPYDLEVAVHKVHPNRANLAEAFEQGETFVGQDSLAKRVVTKIDAQLAERRKDKNMFDDFRPF